MEYRALRFVVSGRAPRLGAAARALALGRGEPVEQTHLAGPACRRATQACGTFVVIAGVAGSSLAMALHPLDSTGRVPAILVGA